LSSSLNPSLSTKIETGDINIMASKEQRIEKEKEKLELESFFLF